MIKYALTCEHDHAFEGWFGASADYDDQAARGLLECPVCASKAVRKQIMAPAVSGTKAQASPEAQAKMHEMVMQAASQVREHVEANFDYVGDTFAREARDIHEGKSEERGIYGEATPAEVKALREDGVKVAALPPAPPKKSRIN
ncbi:MAG: hypothetical protein BGN86_10085 [Caulobacterales bacterium 68-7]|nr:DUF1178 family protein [Caulobacterales bacterium]OJU11258.1 MAG: hypothetical protein BGN86_10085 [Caulobacterales bacterium 68-7]